MALLTVVSAPLSHTRRNFNRQPDIWKSNGSEYLKKLLPSANWELSSEVWLRALSISPACITDSKFTFVGTSTNRLFFIGILPKEVSTAVDS
jgi:hypothetical protein